MFKRYLFVLLSCLAWGQTKFDGVQLLTGSALSSENGNVGITGAVQVSPGTLLVYSLDEGVSPEQATLYIYSEDATDGTRGIMLETLSAGELIHLDNSNTAGVDFIVSGDGIVNTVALLNNATGNEVGTTLAYTVNKATSGTATGLLIDATATAVPGLHYPLEVKVGGSQVFSISETGDATAVGDITLPTTGALRFGEDDTYLEGASYGFRFIAGGIEGFRIRNDRIDATATDGPEMINVTASDTVASFEPAGYSGYGLGGTSTSTSVIAGGAAALTLDASQDATFASDLTVDGLTYNSVTSGITASVTQTQGQGALTSNINEIATCATTNDTVTLPAAAAGLSVLVINNGAETLQIFPASGDDLGAGVNTATTLTAGSSQRFTTYDATNWIQE